MDFQQPLEQTQVVDQRIEKLRQQWAQWKEFAKKHKKMIALIAVGLFLFNWFELRPIRLNNTCMAEASFNARSLLKSKAAVATDATKQNAYAELAAKDMYLRSDYESFFKKCLRRYGINNVQ